MSNWEYEIAIGDPDHVKEELNRLGALGWEIATTHVLSTPEDPIRVLVFLRRPVVSDIPETVPVDLHDYPTFRPHT